MATPLTPSRLLAVLKAEGLVVREYTGWRDRCRCHTLSHEDGLGWAGRGWGTVNGIVNHITGGDLGTRTVPQYIRDIINGDPNLPCKVQLIVAPNGDAWLNSAGRCNHAGGVGSTVQAHMRAADFSLTDDYDDRFRGSSADGNAFTIGIEVITSKTMTAAAHATLVRINAALARELEWTGQESTGHGEISAARVWIDPGLHMGNFRQEVMAAVLGAPAPAPAPTPSVAVYGQPDTWKLGATGPDVVRLGERINVWNAALGYATWVPDDVFSATERDDLSRLQAKAWGFGDTASDLAPGGASDGYPGAQTFAKLDSEPPAVVVAPTPDPNIPVPAPTEPLPASFNIRETYMNRADYDKIHGAATKDARDAGVARTCLEGNPHFIHLVECSASQIDDMSALFVGYARVVPRDKNGEMQSGAGRQSWYRKDAGIKIIAAEMDNVDHMLDSDNKPFLKYVWERGGIRSATTVFHNENQGTTIQKSQLLDVIEAIRDYGKAHSSVLRNTAAWGDTNRKESSADLWGWEVWKNGMLHADVEVNTDRETFNDWVSSPIGRPIDVLAVRRNAHILRAEHVLLGGDDISDHNALRATREIVAA